MFFQGITTILLLLGFAYFIWKFFIKKEIIEKNYYAKPQFGGCWYCYKNTPQLVFCNQFDTYIHIQCIMERKKELERSGESDPEFKLIAEEFGI